MLEDIGPGIWLAEGDVVDFYGFAYPTRCIVVRLSDGGLWIWSPIALSPALVNAIEALGKPVALVSPNKIHHLFLGDWQRQWPAARIWGPRSTIRKRKDLAFETPLDGGIPATWEADLDMVQFKGSFVLDELVFFHRSSRTAILADLSENFGEHFLQHHWKPWQIALAKRWGITKGLAPLEWRLSFWNRKETRKARDVVFAWHAEQVIMAHGEWQRSNGQAYLQRILAWI